MPPARISLTFSSLPAGPQGYTPYPHRATVCRCELVTLPFLGHVVGVHWSTWLMSSSLLLQQCPACLVRQTLIVFVMGGRWPYSCCFVGCCSRTCSILLEEFLCSCRLAFSPSLSLASTWCIHIAVSILPLLGRNCISFYRAGWLPYYRLAIDSCPYFC